MLHRLNAAAFCTTHELQQTNTPFTFFPNKIIDIGKLFNRIYLFAFCIHFFYQNKLCSCCIINVVCIAGFGFLLAN